MVNLHLRPKLKDELFKEAVELTSVVDHIKSNQKKSNPNIVIMGDMNFDCAYINKASRDQIRNRLSNFIFYIEDGVRTTLSQTSCALDRILVNKGQLSKMVSSYGPYYYEKDPNKVGLEFSWFYRKYLSPSFAIVIGS